MTIDDRIFAALADPTRRRLLEWLDDGGRATATEFASKLPMSRQAVTKHLRELEGAGLVRGARHGREMRYASQPEGLADASEWIARRTAAWDDRLALLAERAVSGDRANDDKDTQRGMGRP